jgi:lysozyme family protein
MTEQYSAKFESAVAHVFKEEGGYVKNDIEVANFGITKITYAKFFGKSASIVTDAEIRNMKKDVAKQIYHEKYWLEMKGDSITSSQASKLIFTQMVNRGPGVFKDIKKELGINSSNSIVDDSTIQKINELTTDPDKVKSSQKEKNFLTNRLENNRKFHARLI